MSEPLFYREIQFSRLGDFRNLITGKEKQHMGDLLGIANPSLDKQVPFDAEPIILGAPTFAGEEGRMFWKILQAH
jgi:hypothetical protein